MKSSSTIPGLKRPPHARGLRGNAVGPFLSADKKSVRTILGHFAALREAAGIQGAAFQPMERAIAVHFGGKSGAFSNTLEFSMAVNCGRVSAYRFSYAFPAFEAGTAGSEMEACKRILATLGKEISSRSSALLSLADPAIVQMPLVGVDAGTPTRVKLYLQLFPGAAVKKAALLASKPVSLTTMPDKALLSKLHLVGFDFAAEGVSSVKLYYLHGFMPSQKLRSTYPLCKTLHRLIRASALDGLRDFIEIHKYPAGPDLKASTSFPAVGELDVGLPANGIGLKDLETCFEQGSSGRLLIDALRDAASGRPWAPSRLSVPVEGEKKLNLYYYLLEDARDLVEGKKV